MVTTRAGLNAFLAIVAITISLAVAADQSTTGIVEGSVLDKGGKPVGGADIVFSVETASHDSALVIPIIARRTIGILAVTIPPFQPCDVKQLRCKSAKNGMYKCILPVGVYRASLRIKARVQSTSFPIVNVQSAGPQVLSFDLRTIGDSNAGISPEAITVEAETALQPQGAKRTYKPKKTKSGVVDTGCSGTA